MQRSGQSSGKKGKVGVATLFQAELRPAQIRLGEILSVVLLYKALGVGSR